MININYEMVGTEVNHLSLWCVYGVTSSSVGCYEFPAHEPRCDCDIADGTRLELFKGNVGNLNGGSEV